jgi:hypothetical protein
MHTHTHTHTPPPRHPRRHQPQEDNNTGTFPLQSERFYAALKGHGGAARLVLLPHEGHGYRARESVLHTLYEQVRGRCWGRVKEWWSWGQCLLSGRR